MSGDNSSESDEATWINWFCNLEGNEYFCEIDRSFIEDNFNLYGIKQIIPDNYSKAMDIILDKTRKYNF
jgi:casein kinase II subunit beta